MGSGRSPLPSSVGDTTILILNTNRLETRLLTDYITYHLSSNLTNQRRPMKYPIKEYLDQRKKCISEIVRKETMQTTPWFWFNKFTTQDLELQIDDFFLQPGIKTPFHLYQFLGITYQEGIELQGIPELAGMIEFAKDRTRVEIIDNGFLEDKSFSKWYLEKFQDEVKVNNTSPVINITLDTTPSPHLDIFEEAE